MYRNLHVFDLARDEIDFGNGIFRSDIFAVAAFFEAHEKKLVANEDIGVPGWENI